MTGDDKSQYDDENRAVLGYSYGATSVLYFETVFLPYDNTSTFETSIHLTLTPCKYIS